MTHSITPQDLLEVWERGMRLAPAGRALAMLAASCDTAPETLALLSIGQRDAALLRLREQLFGPRLLCLASCPACGENLELDFDLADIRAAEVAPSRPLAIETCGYMVRFRLPCSLDLAALAPGEDAPRLLERCVVEARRDGEALAAASLPREVVAEVAAEMARADPQADVQLSLACPACAHRWAAAFDIVAFLWSEIDAWARRTLSDVHALASAYGWREAEILALSPWRRQYYLELVAG